MNTDISRLNGTWQTWACALACTLALNLALFSIIPNLMKPGDDVPVPGPMPSQIQLTRLRRPEVKPPEEKPRPPVKQEQKKPPEPVKRNHPAIRSLSLSFEVNPRLPASPGAPVLPHLMSQSLDSLNLTTLFDPGDLDQPLTVLSRIPPVYPFRAKTRGIEGWVSVAFTVTEQGRVADIQILEAQPKTIFDKSVIQCLSAWRFKPGSISGKPVKTRVKTRIRFELK